MSTRLTVYTPCFNSAMTLPGVWDSLQRQSWQDFEWLVVDDGSTDGTSALLEQYQRAARFPVHVLHNAQNVGHAASLNLAVRQAAGELFLKTDSDDTFPPDAFNTLVRHWDAIPKSEQRGFAGVTGCCVDEAGQRLEPPVMATLDVTPADLFFVHKRRRERWGFTRTSLMRQHPVPDVDRFVPESVVWRAIGATYRTRFVDDVVRVYHRGNPSSLSRDPRIRFPRGQAFALAFLVRLEWRFARKDPLSFARRLVDYGMLARLAALTATQASRHLAPRLARTAFWLLAPAWLFLAWRARQRLDPAAWKGDWSSALDSPSRTS